MFNHTIEGQKHAGTKWEKLQENISQFCFSEVETSTDEKTETPIEKPKTKEASSKVSIDDMCKFIYSRDTSDRIRTRAMLCHVYHHALNDRWFEARDLMLMSHLQESIQHSDIPTQVCWCCFLFVCLFLFCLFFFYISLKFFSVLRIKDLNLI